MLPLTIAEAKSKEDSVLSYSAVHNKRGDKCDACTHSYCLCRQAVTTYRPPPPSADQDTMEQLPCLSEHAEFLRTSERYSGVTEAPQLYNTTTTIPEDPSVAPPTASADASLSSSTSSSCFWTASPPAQRWGGERETAQHTVKFLHINTTTLPLTRSHLSLADSSGRQNMTEDQHLAVFE